MTTANEITLEAAALDLGHNFFLSFKQGADRYVNAGLERPGTDEERAAKLLRALPASFSDPVRGYFVRQGQLSATQRARALGDLFDVPIDAPLTARVTAANLLRSRPVQTLIADAHAPGPIARRRGVVVAPPLAKTKVTASLILKSIRVDDSEDFVNIPFFPDRPANDEVILTAISVDPVGRTHQRTMFCGSIDEGEVRKFSATKGLMVAIPFSTGGDSWPKFAAVSMYGAERDDGGWNKVVDALQDYISEKLTDELVADLIGWIPYANKLPDTVIKFIAGVTAGFMRDALDWFVELWRNSDDQMGSRTVLLKMTEASADWKGTGRADSPEFPLTFRNSDGKWTTTWYWHLSEKQVPVQVLAGG